MRSYPHSIADAQPGILLNEGVLRLVLVDNSLPAFPYRNIVLTQIFSAKTSTDPAPGGIHARIRQ
jgi:hypothetical protein